MHALGISPTRSLAVAHRRRVSRRQRSGSGSNIASAASLSVRHHSVGCAITMVGIPRTRDTTRSGTTLTGLFRERISLCSRPSSPKAALIARWQMVLHHGVRHRQHGALRRERSTTVLRLRDSYIGTVFRPSTRTGTRTPTGIIRQSPLTLARWRAMLPLHAVRRAIAVLLFGSTAFRTCRREWVTGLPSQGVSFTTEPEDRALAEELLAMDGATVALDYTKLTRHLPACAPDGALEADGRLTTGIVAPDPQRQPQEAWRLRVDAQHNRHSSLVITGREAWLSNRGDDRCAAAAGSAGPPRNNHHPTCRLQLAGRPQRQTGISAAG